MRVSCQFIAPLVVANAAQSELQYLRLGTGLSEWTFESEGAAPSTTGTRIHEHGYLSVVAHWLSCALFVLS
jgi:hypothetical protein